MRHRQGAEPLPTCPRQEADSSVLLSGTCQGAGWHRSVHALPLHACGGSPLTKKKNQTVVFQAIAPSGKADVKMMEEESQLGGNAGFESSHRVPVKEK